jgi:hypothetical protein
MNMVNKNTALVVAFLNRHDIGFGNANVLRVSEDGATLTVCGSATNADNEPFSEVETIPATMQAARDWLGY